MKIKFTDTSHTQYEDSADEVKYSKGERSGKLYIGNRDCASFLQLRSRKCLTVVNCAADMHGLSRESDVKYLNIDPDLKDSFEDSFIFIDKALSKGKNVTVQCENGLGKSAVIVLNFLMRKMSISLAESHTLLVKARKEKMKINPTLVGKLIAEEKKIRNSISICLDGRNIIPLNTVSRGKKAGASSKGSPIIAVAVFVGFIGILYGVLLFATGKT